MNYVIITYTNWRGETTERKIVPPNGKAIFEVRLDSNSWHPEPCWMFDALDLDRGAIRTFAMHGIKAWKVGDEYSKVAGVYLQGSGA